MNTFIRRTAICSISIVSLLAGCATQTRPASMPMPNSVPGISVVMDCGQCQVAPAIPDLIRTAYADAAAKAGVAIAGDAQMAVTIKEYKDRSMTIRALSVLAGPLAFSLKDEIKAVALVDGKPVALEYSYRVPFWGIETVATKLGEMSFDAAAKQLSKD